MRFFILLSLVISSMLFIPTAFATHSIGGNLGLTYANQADLNTLRSRANTRENGISNSELGSSWELSGYYMYRFNSTMFALLFRPSYLWVSSTGTGASGDFKYGINGFTFFPMLRLYPLENKFIKFFMQTGLGYGYATGFVKEGEASVDFKSSNFGFMLGLGSEFCFTDNHCMVIEGNFRYLPLERNIATSTSGTFASNSIGASPNGESSGYEVEFDNRDLSTTLSGIQGILGYVYHF